MHNLNLKICYVGSVNTNKLKMYIRVIFSVKQFIFYILLNDISTSQNDL